MPVSMTRHDTAITFDGHLRMECVVLTILAWMTIAEVVYAQTASLLGGAHGPPPTLDRLSWIYQTPPQQRTLKLHDLLTVVVDEKTQVISEGQMDRRKKADGKLVLSDWILLKGWSLIPDPQSKGDPTIKGEMENKYRAEAEMQSREAMKLRVACEIVDIRPNGNLVIEGRRTIQVNHDIWEIYLTGTVWPQSILPDNTVLSENVADLRIVKREAGHVRDGYRRGWLLRWLDTHQPF